MIKIYGIKNCDSVKKAIAFLKSNNIEFEFIDFKTDDLSPEKLQQFIDTLGIEKVVNKRSTTYRNLSDKNITSDVILNNLTLIKRPVLENGKQIIIGFDENQYKTLI